MQTPSGYVRLPDFMLVWFVSDSRVHTRRACPLRLSTSRLSSSSSVEPFQVEASWWDGTQSSTPISGFSSEIVSNVGALPLCEEAGACIADAGTVHPDDGGGVVSIVERLASWTTLDDRTTDGFPGTDGDGIEMSCCGT